jgi:hypothetical protein
MPTAACGAGATSNSLFDPGRNLRLTVGPGRAVRSGCVAADGAGARSGDATPPWSCRWRRAVAEGARAFDAGDVDAAHPVRDRFALHADKGAGRRSWLGGAGQSTLSISRSLRSQPRIEARSSSSALFEGQKTQPPFREYFGLCCPSSTREFRPNPSGDFRRGEHLRQATIFVARPQHAKSHDGHASPAVDRKFRPISEWPGISRS